ncbi:MAG: hypothetical protein J6I96_02300 [Oscillospiraceae bacterium]|nr:hypothetical protein [Oscillospiraceae bacterium]
MDFTQDEKVALFDKIAARYFNRNFGTMLKADIDTLIFSAYIEHCLDNSLPFDDYTIACHLGITETKVRGLKERKQLQYPYENYDWKKMFVALIPNARYNDVKKLIQMNIGDVNLLNDVRNYVYSNGWFDEFQLNPRLFQCRLDYFIALCKSLGEDIPFDEKTENALKKLSVSDREMSAIEKILSGSFEDGMSELVKNASKEVIKEILKLLPFGGIAGTALDAIIRLLDK